MRENEGSEPKIHLPLRFLKLIDTVKIINVIKRIRTKFLNLCVSYFNFRWHFVHWKKFVKLIMIFKKIF